MSVPSYNIADGFEASYGVSPDGNTIVVVRCHKPLKFREIYVGTGSLAFRWVSNGKSRSWQFTPSLVDPTPAPHSETLADDGVTQTITVNLCGKAFPASGLVDVNVDGEIVAPAIHFDVPHAYDLWVLLLRSPWFPLKIAVEKSSLNIAHNLAQATAQVDTVDVIGGGEQMLRGDLSVHGEGFQRVRLTMHRSTANSSLEEQLGEVTNGMQTFTWKPVISSFNLMLVTTSYGHLGAFVDFLKYMGAAIVPSSFFGPSLQSPFLLSDGLNMTYRLKLTGDKHIIGHEKDEAAVTLRP
ncbi:MAG TPA: hypothetical protein VJY36_08040 [Candidatus Bathyarchaeia archaeon]|nr:hypothetical protein [Candidatus Bathyarchaeia archaeon]